MKNLGHEEFFTEPPMPQATSNTASNETLFQIVFGSCSGIVEDATDTILKSSSNVCRGRTSTSNLKSTRRRSPSIRKSKALLEIPEYLSPNTMSKGYYTMDKGSPAVHQDDISALSAHTLEEMALKSPLHNQYYPPQQVSHRLPPSPIRITGSVSSLERDSPSFDVEGQNYHNDPNHAHHHHHHHHYTPFDLGGHMQSYVSESTGKGSKAISLSNATMSTSGEFYSVWNESKRLENIKQAV